MPKKSCNHSSEVSDFVGKPKKILIHLSKQDYKKLKSLIRKKGTPLTIRRRCQIILNFDKNYRKILTYEQCYKSNGVCHATISNTVASFTAHGMNSQTT